MMWKETALKPFLIIYTSFLFLATFFLIPTMTSFYYYAWGQHLAWSYFDGPPMIAYLFSISNALFGTTFFSINIVGFLCLMLSAYYVYQSGCLLYNQKTGLISTLIWLALPTTTESVFIRVLYDAPLNLFTVMSFYYFARYISLKRDVDLYFGALCIGAMILSKYTAAVSVLSLLLYIIFSNQRVLFKNPHFYGACLLILFIASPVIYWNVTHDWESLFYLVNFHSQTQTHSTRAHCLMELFFAYAMNFSVFIIVALLGWFKYKQKCKIPTEMNPILEFTYKLLFWGMSFWLITTLLGGDVRVVYLTPLGLYIALAAGYSITRYQYKRFFMIVYPVFLAVSLVMIIGNSWPVASYLKKSITYSVIQKNLHQLDPEDKGIPVVTGYYTYTSLLSFFMPNKQFYTLPCGDLNQYKYWEETFLNDLAQGKIEKVSFIELRDIKQCAERYFNKCEATAIVSRKEIIPIINKITKPRSLYVYECSLPKRDAVFSKS